MLTYHLMSFGRNASVFAKSRGRFLTLILLTALCAMASAQSTLRRVTDLLTSSGYANAVDSRALSTGLVQITETRNQTLELTSVSVIRTTPSGVTIPIESTTNIDPEWNVRVQQSLIDSTGRFAWIGAVQFPGEATRRVIARCSKESSGGGSETGWFLQLAADESGITTDVSVSNSEGVYLVTTANVVTGQTTVQYVVRETGAVIQTATIAGMGQIWQTTSASNGNNYILGSNRTNGDHVLVCLRKDATEAWRIVRPYSYGVPHPQALLAIIANKNWLVVKCGSDQPGQATTETYFQSINPNTGVVTGESVHFIGQQDLYILDRAKILDNGDLIGQVETDKNANFTAFRMSPNLAVQWQTPVVTNPSPTGHQPRREFEFDAAGNCVVANSIFDSATHTYSERLTYIENSGNVRWDEIVETFGSSFSTVGINVSIAPDTKIYFSYGKNLSSTNPSSGRFRTFLYEPAIWLPVSGDTRGNDSTILYRKFDGTAIRLVKLTNGGTSTTNFQSTTDWTPKAMVRDLVGTTYVLFTGLASNSGRVVKFNLGNPTPVIDSAFTLPFGSGTIRDISVDSTSRIWIMASNSTATNTVANHFRLNLAGSAVDTSRTLYISNLPSGAFGFEAAANGTFRVAANSVSSGSILSRFFTLSTAGAFAAELDRPSGSIGVQDLSCSTQSKTYYLLTDALGLEPSTVVRVSAAGTAIELDIPLPWSPGRPGLSVGAVGTANFRVAWNELGGKIFLQDFANGVPGAIRIVNAQMN